MLRKRALMNNAAHIIPFFKDLQKTGRLSHAWILKGERHIGKRSLAFDIAKNILYANETQPHGLPNSFIDAQIARKSYPNFFLLEKQVDADGIQSKDISAEEGKQVRRFLTLKPAVMGWRVIVIDALDDLNRFAANSILKMLEEPPERVCFLMICHQLGHILPTIRSRAKVLHIEGSPHFEADTASFIKTLQAFLQGNMGLMEPYSKSATETDKTLTNFRYMVLNQLYNWVKNQDVPSPAFVQKYPTHHWVDAFAAVNQFFNAFDDAHLDPLHSIAATFLLIQNPHLETFLDVMSPPF
ncbi:MAG: hypothetical protein CNLJKLNK_01098 [Holosporales bacterium]